MTETTAHGAVSTSDATPWRVLVLVCAMVSIYGVTGGITTPVISLLLEARGYERTIIGLNGAAVALGIMVFSPFAPRFMRQMGVIRFCGTCLALDLLALLAIPATDNVVAWFGIRFFMGCMAAGLFLASETWVNAVVSDRHRGRVLAAYNAIMSISLGVGPLVLTYTGVYGWAPFLVGAGFMLVAGAALVLVAGDAPEFDGGSAHAAFSIMSRAPTLVLSVLLVALVWGGAFALLPVYGVRSGLTETDAAFLLTVMSIGGVSLQYPIGWLGDVMNRYVVLIGCAILSTAGAAAIPFAVGDKWLLWTLLFFWGGTFSAIYTMSMAIAGQRFRGGALANMMAAFGIMWGLGMAIGPAGAGAAMDIVDPDGLPIALTLAGALFVAFAIYRRRRTPVALPPDS